MTFLKGCFIRHTNMNELSYISEMISLPQAFKLLSCNYQQSSWCSGFLQCGELSLITSCLFWALSNFAPSSSSVSQPILDNTREGKWSGGRRGYHGIWISQEISSCNIFKGLWAIPVTSWPFFPYWLVHQCWSFPLPLPIPSLLRYLIYLFWFHFTLSLSPLT